MPCFGEQKNFGNCSFISEVWVRHFYRNQTLKWGKKSCFQYELFTRKHFWQHFWSTGTSIVTELPYLVCNRSEWYKLSIPLTWKSNQIFIFCVVNLPGFVTLALKIPQIIPDKTVFTPTLNFPKK